MERRGNLGNVLQKITSPATVKAFEKMGVDLPAALKRMYAEGKTPIEAIAELTNKTLKGDLSRIGFLFEDAQVQAGLRPLIQNMEEYRRIRAEAGNAGGTTDRDFAERMRDWDGIAAYFGGIWDSIAGFFTSNWTTIRNLLLGALVIFMPLVAALIWVAAAVYRNWDMIKAGFMSGITALWGYVQPIVQPILNILSTIENLRQRFFRMGGDLIMGLLRGLMSAAGGVLRFVGNLAARIGQRFADALGIRSPSRVFMAHGGHLMTGLQRGIDRGADGPLGRITRLSAELGGAMALGAATPAMAGAAPPGSTAGGGFATMSVTIHINGADRAPGEIGREVENALERIDARRRAASFSQFADRPDWNV